MIKLIPLGGYVMLAGETDEDDNKFNYGGAVGPIGEKENG